MSKQVISFHYTLKDKSGQVLDRSADGQPLSYLTGVGQIIPGLEEALSKLKAGDKTQIVITAEKAYGPRDEKLVRKVSRSKLPNAKVSIGDRFRGGSDPHAPVFTVTALSDTEITLDGNHPLAGQDLHFDIEIAEIRDATAEETQHGHTHGGCGCGDHHH